MEGRSISEAKQIKISISDIIDFCFCPRYYDIKHKHCNEKNIKDYYDETLHTTFYHYLIALQNGVLINSLEFLKKQWGEEWIKQKTNREIIFTPSATSRDTHDNKRKMGIDAIITFDKLMNEPQVPIVINMPYELKVTDKITVIGVWEYIREVPLQDNGHEFQIMKFRTENNKFQVNRQRYHDLELTSAYIAFKKKFRNEARLVYVDVYAKKIVPSFRGDKDIKDFVHTIQSVAACLKHNIRCYSPDKKCYHCEYRDECLK